MDNKKLTAHQCYVKSVKENNIIVGLRTSFVDMLKNKYPQINVDRVILIFDEQYKTICPQEPVLPLNCDLNKHLLVAVLDEFGKTVL